jgi:hypothetical protein
MQEREEREREQQKAAQLLQEVVGSVQIESEQLSRLQASSTEARKMLLDVETRVGQLRKDKIAASLELARLEEEAVLVQSRGMEEEATRRRREREIREKHKASMQLIMTAEKSERVDRVANEKSLEMAAKVSKLDRSRKSSKVDNAPRERRDTANDDVLEIFKPVELYSDLASSGPRRSKFSSRDLSAKNNDREVSRIRALGFTSTSKSPSRISSVFREMDKLQQSLLQEEADKGGNMKIGSKKNTPSGRVQTEESNRKFRSNRGGSKKVRRSNNVSIATNTLRKKKTSTSSGKKQKPRRRKSAISPKPVPFISASRRNTIIGRYRYGAMSKKLKFGHEEQPSKSQNKKKDFGSTGRSSGATGYSAAGAVVTPSQRSREASRQGICRPRHSSKRTSGSLNEGVQKIHLQETAERNSKMIRSSGPPVTYTRKNQPAEEGGESGGDVIRSRVFERKLAEDFAEDYSAFKDLDSQGIPAPSPSPVPTSFRKFLPKEAIPPKMEINRSDPIVDEISSAGGNRNLVEKKSSPRTTVHLHRTGSIEIKVSAKHQITTSGSSKASSPNSAKKHLGWKQIERESIGVSDEERASENITSFKLTRAASDASSNAMRAAVIASARKQDIQRFEDNEHLDGDTDSSTSDANLMDVSVDGTVGDSEPNIAALAHMATSIEHEEKPKQEIELHRGGFMARGHSSNSTFDESSQNDAESRVIRVGEAIMTVGSPNTSLGARAFLLQQGLQKQVEQATRTEK